MAVHFTRARPFAAVIPGDSVAEQVITSGISSFLSLYNAALIGRLILTWYAIKSKSPRPSPLPLYNTSFN
jgi:hypothetical protein